MRTFIREGIQASIEAILDSPEPGETVREMIVINEVTQMASLLIYSRKDGIDYSWGYCMLPNYEGNYGEHYVAISTPDEIYKADNQTPETAVEEMVDRALADLSATYENY